MASGGRPSPQAAYVQWTAGCAEAGWRGVPAAERIPVVSGLGRVTAGPVSASWPSPRFDCAAMDGIAITAGSGAPGDRWELPGSAFIWVDTGDPMPAGTDTVVERERVQVGADGSAQITGPAPRGRHVRARGEDFPAGQLLIPAGHRLRPADLAVAAAAGHATLEVARQPLVAIIPTGDEIRPVGSALGPGEIVDSNSLMLASQVTELGARPAVTGVQPDEQDVIAGQVRRCAAEADLVLVIAGSSAGRGDYTAAVLGQVGALVVKGVAVRPGHPALLGYASLPGRPGQAAIVPVIGIPGYPLAAAVIFELFAAPLLALLLGALPAARARQRVELACGWSSSPDVEDWVPVSLARAPGGAAGGGHAVLATPGRRGAGAISRLTHADAWWPIPIGRAQFERGEQIDVLPITGPPVTGAGR
jgi:putative molybdopterin biosynthesis protein